MKKKKAPKTRNPIVHALRTPQFRPKTIPNKKKNTDAKHKKKDL